MMYFVIAMAIYMGDAYREILRRLVEGIQWLMPPEEREEVAGKAAVSRGNFKSGALLASKLSRNGFGSARRSIHTCSLKDCAKVPSVISRRG